MSKRTTARRPTRLPTAEFRKLPQAEQDALLDAAVERMVEDYQNDLHPRNFEAFDPEVPDDDESDAKAG